MLFKRKDDHFKDIEAKYKNIETKTNEEISEIEKLPDSAERLARYEALSETLLGFYNGGKPKRVTGRKETRAKYGSVKNARALYKIEQTVKERAAKEAEAIQAAERVAQLQQQFEAAFEKEATAKDKSGLYKEVKAEVSEDIKEIKKIADPAERVARYQALDKTLDGFYDGMKPEVTDGESAAAGGILGGLAGWLGVGLTAAAIAPQLAVPVGFAIAGGGAISVAIGGAGLAGFLGGKKDRKQLRAKYGSIRNARALYKLDKTVQKKTEKDAEPLRSRDRAAKLQQQVEDAFKKKDPAAPAESAPAQTLKLLRPPEAKQ